MDESESAKQTPPTALPAQRCSSCGTVLKAEGFALGAWVKCPNCRQPVRFEAPKPPPKPKPAVKPLVSPPPLARPDVPSWTPRPVVGRRLGCGPATLISMMAGFAQMVFAAAFLNVRNPIELLLTAVFGFVVAMASGYVMISASSRAGWESTKNDRRY